MAEAAYGVDDGTDINPDENMDLVGENETSPLNDWPNPPTLTQLKEDLTDAEPAHNAQTDKIRRWLDNLRVEGSAKPKKVAGRSEVQPKLIRKQAEWRYSSLADPFLSTPDLFDVRPVSFEDREAAQQNQILLNNQFTHKMNRVKFIDRYVRAATDEGTAIVQVGWDFEEEMFKEEEPIVELVEDPSTGELHQQIHQMMQENPAAYEQEVPPELKIAHEASMEDGVPYRPEVVGMEMVEKMKTVKNQPSLRILNSNNVVIDPTCEGDFDRARFVIIDFESSLAELQKDGRYHNLDNIQLESNSVLSDPDHEVGQDQHNFKFKDKPRKKFVVYEYWGFWDIDNSGTLTPIVSSWVGATLIRQEIIPFPDKKLPFVVVPYMPVPYSCYGEPDGELLEDNQKISGAVARGMIDLLARSANGQMGTRKDALDLVNRRKFERGDDYEFNSTADPRQAFFMHQYPEIPTSAQFMLQLQNADAESMTGVKAFHEGISGQSLGDTATGARGAMDAASKRELGILRRLADGLTQIGRKVIAMNSVFLEEEEVVRVTNSEFIPIRRDDLAGNFDLRLTVSTAEEDSAKAQELAFMLQTMGPNEDPMIRKMILSDITRLRKMPDLAQKLEDYEPQPDPMQVEAQKLQLELLKAQIAKEYSQVDENKAEAALDYAKAVVEQVKAGHLQADTDLKTLDFVEQETGVKQERDLQKMGEQAKGNILLEKYKAQLARQKQA